MQLVKKKYFTVPACAALSLLALPAMAQNSAQGARPASYLDLYYVAKADLDVNDFEFDDGDGFGGKGRFTLADTFFLSGEYQNNEYDPFEEQGGTVLNPITTRYEVEIETFRIGGGVYFAETPFFVAGEYIDYEAEVSTTGSENEEETVGEDTDDSGFGVHAGVDGTFGPGVGLHAQVGYVDIGDVGDGVEFLVGGSFSFTPGFGIFADYRRADLKNGDDNFEPADLRVGLRLSFI